MITTTGSLVLFILSLLGIGIGAMANRYAGRCPCGDWVPAGDGEARRIGGRYRAVCPRCVADQPSQPNNAPPPSILDRVKRLPAHMLSAYQRAILRAVASLGLGCALLVEAVAGSGKSATIIEIVCDVIKRAGGPRAQYRMAREIVVCAFNKHIKAAFEGALPEGVLVRTIHSLGYQTVKDGLGRYDLDTVASKYRTIAREQLDVALEGVGVQPETADDRASLRRLIRVIVQLIGTVRTQLIPDDQITIDRLVELAENYGYVLPLEVCDERLAGDALLEVLRDVVVASIVRGAQVAEQAGVLDYTDQIYLPWRYGFAPARQGKYVLVDEAQDLSPAQLDVVLRQRITHVKGHTVGKLIAVGDRHQAIYGFAGADCASLDRIAARTNARELPLSVCYRCPTSHLEMAREIVPQIEASPNAIVGEVVELPERGWLEAVQPEGGDLVICRTNAPLIGLVYRLWARGIRARMRGRDLSAQLREQVRQAEEDGATTIDAVCILVEAQATAAMDAVRAVDPDVDDEDPRIVAIEDRAAGLLGLVEVAAPATIDELYAAIERVAGSDEPELDEQTVWLSSIHRAKGDQARRVIVINADRIALPSPIDWQQAQEINLEYIAYTRAKESLILVASPPRR